MREVVVLGVGLHPFGRWPEKSKPQMAREAIWAALDDAGMTFKQIEALWVGCVKDPSQTAWTVLSEVGQTGIPILNVESACASSSSAFREAYWAIAAGVYDIAMAAGVEKMARGLQGANDPNTYGGAMGLGIMPAIYARRAKLHMKEYGSKPEHFAQVSVKSHRCATLNPYAQYQKACTLDEVLNSRMIAEPITLLQCSPSTDGASAIVLCAKEKAAQFTGKPISIAGWACGTPAYLGGEGDDLSDEMVQRVAKQARERAGVGVEDIDVLQVHDAFAPGEVLTVEALGFCPEGEGGHFVWEGQTDIGGKIPTNTDGGLLSRGHPMGATGCAQLIEIVRQLRGEAGARQVENAKVGMTHNVGIGACNIHILKK